MCSLLVNDSVSIYEMVGSLVHVMQSRHIGHTGMLLPYYLPMHWMPSILAITSFNTVPSLQVTTASPQLQGKGYVG